MTSVENERCFSVVNKIQNKYTNSLTVKHLYEKVLIYLNKKKEFDFDCALKNFLKERNEIIDSEMLSKICFISDFINFVLNIIK